MATFTGQLISATYDAIIKTVDNDPIGSTAKLLTDGLGNNTPLYVSTTQIGIGITPTQALHVSGNAIITGSITIDTTATISGNLSWGSLTDTGESITITKFVDAADGIANNNNDTTIPTSAAVKSFVDSSITAQDLDFQGDNGTSGSIDLDSQTFAINGTTNQITTVSGGQSLTIALPYNITIGGNVNATTFVGNLNGNVNGGTIAGTTGTFSGNVDIDGTLDVDDLISIESNAFGRIEIGGSSGGYIDLKAPASDDYDLRIITSSSGNELTTASGDLIFNTAETLALTIDTSQNSTFAGTISGVLADGVTATTQSANDASTKVATTSYADAAASAIPIGDYLELAGGTMTGNTSHNDNIMSIYGTGSDLQIYHDGVDSFIKELGVGALKITSNQTLFYNVGYVKLLAEFDDIGVKLYYDNVKKFETTSTGVSVTGKISNLTDPSALQDAATKSYVDSQVSANNELSEVLSNGNTTGGTDIVVSTSDQILLPDGSETNPSIAFSNDTDNGIYGVNGSFFITVNGGKRASFAENFISFKPDGFTRFSVDYNGIFAYLDLSLPDDKKAIFGTGNDLQIYHNGTNSIIDNNTNNLLISTASQTIISSDATDNQLTLGHTTGNWFAKATNSNTLIIGSESNATNNITLDVSSGGSATFAGDVTLSSGYLNVTTDGSVAYGLIINSGDQSHSRIRINNTGSGGNAWSIMSGTSGVSNDGFAIRNESTTTTALQFTNTGNATFAGNLGVGNAGSFSNPNSYAKVIEIAASSPTGLILNDTRGAVPMSIDNSGEVMNLRYNTTIMLGLDGATSNATFAGNVGIGVTGTPDSLLHIKGETKAYITFEDTTDGVIGFVGDAAQMLTSGTVDNLGLRGEGGIQFGISDVIKMVLDSSGNVGIGGSPASKLDVIAATGDGLRVSNSTSVAYNVGLIVNFNDVSTMQLQCLGTTILQSGNTGDTVLASRTNKDIVIEPNGSGGVEIVAGNDAAQDTILWKPQITNEGNGAATNYGAGVKFKNSSSAEPYKWAGIAGVAGSGYSNSTDLVFYASSNSTQDAVERMRVTGGGNILANKTITGQVLTDGFEYSTDNYLSICNSVSTNYSLYVANKGASGTRNMVAFYGTSSVVGSITYNGTVTAYNTTSDYRLKEDLKDFNGLDKVSKISVYDFKWKSEESRSYGVMAHELEEVLPDAVSGEKDAEEMQMVDYSKIVPLLVKSIQELTAKVEKLEQECKCK